MIQGPNVKLLISHKASLLMIPPGTSQPFAHAMTELTKPGNLVNKLREATKWVEAAITAIRTAPLPNPWRDKTDEEIAGELWVEISKRQNKA